MRAPTRGHVRRGMPHDPANLTGCEVVTPWDRGRSYAPDEGSYGVIGMRSVFALGLFIFLYASAHAATVHHFRTRHPVTIQPSQDTCVPPACYKFPGYPPLPPQAVRTLDPSTFGGG